MKSNCCSLVDEAVDAADDETASLLLSLCSTDGGSIQKPPTFGSTIMGYGGPACGRACIVTVREWNE